MGYVNYIMVGFAIFVAYWFLVAGIVFTMAMIEGVVNESGWQRKLFKCVSAVAVVICAPLLLFIMFVIDPTCEAIKQFFISFWKQLIGNYNRMHEWFV